MAQGAPWAFGIPIRSARVQLKEERGGSRERVGLRPRKMHETISTRAGKILELQALVRFLIAGGAGALGYFGGNFFGGGTR